MLLDGFGSDGKNISSDFIKIITKYLKFFLSYLSNFIYLDSLTGISINLGTYIVTVCKQSLTIHEVKAHVFKPVTKNSTNKSDEH